MPQTRPFIYLDNAATSLPKPRGVAEAVAEAIGRAGNPGRSGHLLSIGSARDLFIARERLAELFGCRDSSRFAFTENATGSLNRALKGLLKPGDHCVASPHVVKQNPAAPRKPLLACHSVRVLTGEAANQDGLLTRCALLNPQLAGVPFRS